jgi:hypothetical protein
VFRGNETLIKHPYDRIDILVDELTHRL